MTASPRPRGSGGRRGLTIVRGILAVALTAAPACAQDFTLSEQQFNAWVTQGNQSPEETVQGQLDAQLRSLERTLKLTPYQREKLELGGEIDVARLRAQVDLLRDKFVGKTFDQNRIGEVFNQIAPLQRQVQAGALGSSSMYFKVLRTVLEAKQRHQFDRNEYERARIQYDARLLVFIAALDASIAMTDAQRTALYELLRSETRPPTRFGSYDNYYVMWRASLVPRQRIAAILDDAQMTIVSRCLARGKGFEQMLAQQGVTPREQIAEDAAAEETPQ